MKRIIHLITLLALAAPLLVANQSIENVSAADNAFNPIIHYDFSDASNLGKDSSSSFDLSTYGSGITKTANGIHLDGNSVLYSKPLGSKDFSDQLDAFTVTIWAKEDSIGQKHRFIIGTGAANSSYGFGLGFYETNGALISPIGSQGYAEHFVTSQADSFGPKSPNYQSVTQWNCFTFMVQDGTAYYGVNGDLYPLQDVSISTFNNPGQTFTIGGVAPNTISNLDSIYWRYTGEIADVRIYNDVLTQSEFQSIYNAGIKGSPSITRKNAITAINNAQTGGYHYDLEVADITASKVMDAVKDLTVSVKVDENGTAKDIAGKIVWANLVLNTNDATIDGLVYLKGYALPTKLYLKVHLSKTMVIWLNTTFTDHMVLQRGQKVKIFGYGGTDGSTVTVTFNGQTKSGTIADSNWAVYLDPMTANKNGQNLVVTCKSQTITLTDVVVGDVLLCSGQSNMAITVQYILNKRASVQTEYTSLNNYQNIRVYDSSSVYLEKTTPTIYDESLGRVWKQCSDFNSIKNFSAYAMAAASNYSSVVGSDVPIGVIVAAIGGSCIEEWLDPVGVKTIHSYASEMSKVDSRFYNAYIYNLAGYTVKALLWNQGCANSQPRMVADYKQAFKVLMDKWRSLFESEFPILVQQLPQFDSWCETYQFRLGQWDLMNSFNNVYTINGFDTGDMDPTDGIHATDKWILGKRVAGALAYISGIAKSEMLNQNLPYGISSAIKSATWTREGNKTIIELTTTGTDDVWTANGLITGFEIKSDGSWSDATAYVTNGKIYLETEKTNVTNLRYNCYTGYIGSGSQSYAKVGTPVFPYNQNDLPLAIAGETKVTKKVVPTPDPTPTPEPTPTPTPTPIPSTSKLSTIAIVGIIAASVVVAAAVVIGIILVAKLKH